MRRRLPFDVWLCLAISVLISLPVGKVVKTISEKSYVGYVEEHTVEAGEIGGVAGEEVFRAESVEDLLSHDTFTVISPGMEYSNQGGGYYGSGYMDALTLPSGERVAARINNENVQHTGETIFDGDSILPVGRVVYEDLTQNESFLEQIQYGKPLSRTDFYIDMLGEGGKMSEENYLEMPVMLAQIVTVIIFFPILHALGARLGLFPYYFKPKEKKEQN